jgi:hypothetical protein
MNASFDDSLIGLIKNETTFTVDTITTVQNRNLQPIDQRSLIPSIQLPIVINLCCCCFVVVVVLLIIVTKRKLKKVIKVFFYFYLNEFHYFCLKKISTNARPFEDITIKPPDDSAQSNQIV